MSALTNSMESESAPIEDFLSKDPMRSSPGNGGDVAEGVEGDYDEPSFELASGPFVIRFDDASGEEVVLMLENERHARGYYREISTNRRELEVWLPSFRNAYRSLEETQSILRQEIDWMYHAKCLRWSVLVNGMVKGNVGLNVIDWKGKVGYLGYWLSSDVQRRGIASRAVKEVCRLGFEELGLEHMDISARKQNARSAAIATRLGFTQQPDIEDNEPGVKFPLNVYTMTRQGAKRSIDSAREEFFLVNAMGYFGRKDPIAFSMNSKDFEESAGLFGNIFKGWGS